MIPIKITVVSIASIVIAVIYISGAHSSTINRHARSITPKRDPRGFLDTKGLCQSEGYYQNKTDCNQYYRCVNFWDDGRFTIFQFKCGVMTAFDEVLSVCVRPLAARPACRPEQLCMFYPPHQTISGPSQSMAAPDLLRLDSPPVQPPYPSVSGMGSTNMPTPPLECAFLNPSPSTVPIDSSGKSTTVYSHEFTTYTIYYPWTEAPSNQKFVRPGEKVKLEITTTVAPDAFGSVTMIYGQDVGLALDPSGPIIGEGEGSIISRTVNVQEGATTITETQIIEPTETVQGGRTTTLYRTVRVTRTLAPTQLTSIIRPTTIFLSNQVITSTVYETLTLRPLTSSLTYYSRPTVTIVNDETITQTVTELFTSNDVNPVSDPSYFTTTILELSTFFRNYGMVTEIVEETIFLQSKDLLARPSDLPDSIPPITRTYLNAAVIQSLGQQVTSTISKTVLLRKYQPTLATIVRPETVTISGQVVTTTRIQTVTLQPSTGLVTSIIKPTLTIKDGLEVSTMVTETYFIEPKDISEGELYEIEGSRNGGTIGTITNLTGDPNDNIQSSQVISPDHVGPGNTLFFTYIQWLTLRPQVSTIYQTSTIIQNGSPVIITVLQSEIAPQIVDTVLRPTRVVAGPNGELVVDSQTVQPTITTTVFVTNTFQMGTEFVTGNVAQEITLQASDIVRPTVEADSAITASPVTLTYLNSEVVESFGQLVTTVTHRTVVLRPYQPSLATVVRPTTVTISDQVQTTMETQTVILRPSTGLVTSIIKPTSTFVNGLVVSTSVTDFYLMETEDVQQVGENSFQIEGTRNEGISETITWLQVGSNGDIISSQIISPEQVQPGNSIVVTYTEWLTLRPQIRTIYNTVTVTENGAPVTLTVLRTVQPPRITSAILRPTKLLVGESGQVTIGSETTTLNPTPFQSFQITTLYETETLVNTITKTLSGTIVIQVVTSIIVIATTSTVSVEPVTVTVPGNTVTDIVTHTITSGSEPTFLSFPSSSLEGSISSIGSERSVNMATTPPLASSAGLPLTQPPQPSAGINVFITSQFPPATFSQLTSSVLDGSTTYVILSPATQGPDFVEPSKPIPLLLTTTVVEVDGMVVTTVYGQNVGPGLDSSGPIVGDGPGWIVEQSTFLRQGLTTITETQLIQPTEVLLANGQRSTSYGTVRVTRTLAPSLITALMRPTTVFLDDMAVTQEVLQTITLRPIKPRTTYMVYESTGSVNGQQSVTSITELYTVPVAPSRRIREAITETVFSTSTFLFDTQWVTASILETLTLSESYAMAFPTHSSSQATAASLTYLNPSAVISEGQFVSSTLFQTLTLDPFHPISLKFQTFSTLLIKGLQVTRTLMRTVTRIPAAGFLSTIVKPKFAGSHSSVNVTETYVINPTQVSFQGEMTEIVDTDILRVSDNFTNLVYNANGGIQSSQVVQPSEVKPGNILSLLYWQVLTLRPLRAPVLRSTILSQNGEQVTLTLIQPEPAVTQRITVIRPTTVRVDSKGVVSIGSESFVPNHNYTTRFLRLLD